MELIFNPCDIVRELKKKRARGLGTETNTCMSEVLALTVEALLPLRQKAVNDCPNGTAHSPTFSSLHLRHRSFSNPSVAYLCHSSFSNPSVVSPTSQLILKPFFRFSYITGSSLTSPGEPPMVFLSSFSFSLPSFAKL